MKKIISILTVTFILIGCFAFYASAETYSERNFEINIPSTLISDDELAAQYDMTKSWYTEDENFLVDLSIDSNTNDYTYVNYSERDFKNIFENYMDDNAEAEFISLVNGENITAGGNFKGIRLNMHYNDGDFEMDHIVCAFSTESVTYTVYFYVYDSSYDSYVDSIINSISIVGSNYDPEQESKIEYVSYIIAVVVVSAISGLIKKRKAKKAAAVTEQEPKVYYQPTSEDSAQSAEADERIVYQPEEATQTATGFAAQEAEKERKEREKMFD